jgi:hypothetical protein
MAQQSKTAETRGFFVGLAWRLAEFFTIIQLWFIANLHHFEETVAQIEFARAGFKFFDWTGRVLEFLDRAIWLLKIVDDKVFYATLNFLLGLAHIRTSREIDNEVFIFFGTLYVAWTSATKVYGAVLGWVDARGNYKKLQNELETGAPIAGGIIIGLLLGGPVGAVIGGLWGAATKSDLKDEVEKAQSSIGNAQWIVVSTIAGAFISVGLDYVMNYGLHYLHANGA